MVTLLEAFHERKCGFTVTRQMGRTSNTKWSQVGNVFGDTIVKYTCVTTGKRIHTTLMQFMRQWDMATQVFMFPMKRERNACDASVTLDCLDLGTELRKASDIGLEFLWHDRKKYTGDMRKRARTMIWEECERRFGDCRTPIEI